MKKLVLVIILILLSIVILTTWLMNRTEQADFISDQRVHLTGDGCLILNYHRIRSSNPFMKTLDKFTLLYKSDSEIQVYSVYKADFEKQVNYLKDNGFTFINPDQLKAFLKEENSIPKKCALITFDDVDLSVYENAYPFLLENKIPFTLFIVTGDVGNPDFKGLKMATWDHIKEMRDSGLATIGGHTHHMHFLEKNNNPPFLNPENMADFVEDTQKTIAAFEEKLGFTPVYYAYPYGFGMPKTDEILLQSGYEMLFSLEPGLVQKGDPLFFTKRVLISKYNWPDIVEWVERQFT